MILFQSVNQINNPQIHTSHEMQKQNPRSEDTGLHRAAALKKSKKLGSEAQRAGSNVLFNQEGGGQTAGGGGASMH